MHDPSCSDLVALVATETSEEQHYHAVLSRSPSGSSPAIITGFMEAEYSEEMTPNLIVNGTK
jgi:hypothetical protein